MARNHKMHVAEIEGGSHAFHPMNAERLIAETRKHRSNKEAEFTLARAIEGARLLLEFMLSTFDYEEQIAEPPAMIARSLAALVARMEDSPAFATRQ